ncbi:MAG: kynureninase [Chitinophagales bacterium]
MASTETQRSIALEKDSLDPLRKFRDSFYFPRAEGRDAIYFCGNSLGLQPKTVETAIKQELQDWRDLAVLGYTRAKNPWLFYQQQFQKTLSTLAGCLEDEVTVMNTLTMNLHLMLLSFYRPSGKRYKIIMEAGAFPSDQYAVETQVRFYGLEPASAIIEIAPRPGEKLLLEEDILQVIDENRDSLALVLLGGINYYSGQLFDMKSITQAAHKAGALAGFDLAHAMGNVLLALHDWDVDFAVWCSYKYLNGGPGSVGGAYIHERYARDRNHIRLGGWWGNDERTRFLMEKGFIAKPDANGWNLSTAQVFNMVCLKASLEIFEMATIKEIRKKSVELTGYLESMVRALPRIKAEIITPADPSRRGAQLSMYFAKNGRDIFQRMQEDGIIVDYREPGVIRVAPAPLYNSFEDVFRFCEILKGQAYSAVN